MSASIDTSSNSVVLVTTCGNECLNFGNVRSELVIYLNGTSSKELSSSSAILTASNDYGSVSVELDISYVSNGGGGGGGSSDSNSSSNTWWIVLVIILSVVIVGLGAAFGYKWYKKRRDAFKGSNAENPSGNGSGGSGEDQKPSDLEANRDSLEKQLNVNNTWEILASYY